MENLIKFGLCFNFEKSEYIVWKSNDVNGGSKIKVKFGCLYADSPARCFALGIKYFNGYYGCSRCTTKGSFKKDRTCFPELNAPLRTDESFLNKLQIEHHRLNFDSILVTKLNILPIKQVPLDTMHLLYSGVTKKIITCLMSCKLKNKNVGLNSQQKKLINEKLSNAIRNELET